MSRAGDVVVVTPEHVEIVLTPAGLGSRFLAIAIDSILTIGLPALAVRLLAPALSGGVAYATFMTAQFFFTFVYHVYCETMYQGRTLGKRALRLRAVDARGLPMTAPQSLVRNALRIVDSLPGLYGFGAMTSLIDPHGRRLGDIAAQTLVVEESAPARFAGSLLAERQFNTLRTPRTIRLIRNRIGLEERELLLELLLRADRLEPARRFELMEIVGSYYRTLLGVDDPRVTGENLVRNLTNILFDTPLAEPRRA